MHPNAKSAAKFKNCVNEPLVAGENHELIIDIIYIPELHIHLGIVNRLVRELNDRWEKNEGAGKNPFYKWAEKMNIQSEGYWSIQIMKYSLLKRILALQFLLKQLLL